MVLVYQDEVHFQRQATITAGWFKKGSTPTVKSFPGRDKVSYSGFVIPETGELFVDKPETFNYETTITSIRSFIKEHPLPDGKKYALIMDNAPWHKKVKRLIQDEKQPEYADILSQVVNFNNVLPVLCSRITPPAFLNSAWICCAKSV